MFQQCKCHIPSLKRFEVCVQTKGKKKSRSGKHFMRRKIKGAKAASSLKAQVTDAMTHQVGCWSPRCRRMKVVNQPSMQNSRSDTAHTGPCLFLSSSLHWKQTHLTAHHRRPSSSSSLLALNLSNSQGHLHICDRVLIRFLVWHLTELSISLCCRANIMMSREAHPVAQGQVRVLITPSPS